MEIFLLLLIVFLPLTNCLPFPHARNVWRPRPAGSPATLNVSLPVVSGLPIRPLRPNRIEPRSNDWRFWFHAMAPAIKHQGKVFNSSLVNTTTAVASSASSSPSLAPRSQPAPPTSSPLPSTPAARNHKNGPAPPALKAWYDLLQHEISATATPDATSGAKPTPSLSHDELLAKIMSGPVPMGRPTASPTPGSFPRPVPHGGPATPSSAAGHAPGPAPASSSGPILPRAPAVITTHDYPSMLGLAPNNPPFCGMHWNSLDLSRVTAMQNLSPGDCGTCLEVCGAAGCADVLAIDRGGRGLDLTTAAKARVLGAGNDIGEASWREVELGRCSGIWNGRMFFDWEAPPGKLVA